MSATRLAFLVWTLAVTAAWLIVSLKTMQLQDLDPNVLWVIGVLMTGKVVQSYSPNDGPQVQPAKQGP